MDSNRMSYWEWTMFNFHVQFRCYMYWCVNHVIIDPWDYFVRSFFYFSLYLFDKNSWQKITFYGEINYFIRLLGIYSFIDYSLLHYLFLISSNSIGVSVHVYISTVNNTKCQFTKDLFIIICFIVEFVSVFFSCHLFNMQITKIIKAFWRNLLFEFVKNKSFSSFSKLKYFGFHWNQFFFSKKWATSQCRNYCH